MRLRTLALVLGLAAVEIGQAGAVGGRATVPRPGGARSRRPPAAPPHASPSAGSKGERAARPPAMRPRTVALLRERDRAGRRADRARVRTALASAAGEPLRRLLDPTGRGRPLRPRTRLAALARHAPSDTAALLDAMSERGIETIEDLALRP